MNGPLLGLLTFFNGCEEKLRKIKRGIEKNNEKSTFIRNEPISKLV